MAKKKKRSERQSRLPDGGSAPAATSPLEQALNTAFQHHISGDLGRAKALYESILQSDPNQPDALYLLGVVARQVGELDAAFELLAKAISLAPENAEAHYNLAIVHQAKGDEDAAIAGFRKTISLQPKHAGAYSNLGTALTERNEIGEAIECHRKALSIEPKIPEIHVNLGNALRSQGKLDDAVSSYRKAVSLQPNFAEAHNSLGVVYQEQGKLDDAEACFKKAISVDPDHGLAHFNFGSLLKKLNRVSEAEDHYLRAIELMPEFTEAQTAYGQLLSSEVKTWHFSMMNDVPRNEAYDGAIKSAVKPDSFVLEIGTGAGLLAMMVARSGAKEVVTVEAVPTIAKAAKNIIAKNGYGDVVTVHNDLSTNLKVGRDLPRKADILVAEIFDVGLLGENAVESIKHARAELLKENAVIIPARATVHGALFESAELYKTGKVGTLSGFDLSPFNAFTRTYGQESIRNYPYAFLSDEFEVFSFDFMGAEILPETKQMSVKATKSGVCHGIAFWFRLYLDDTHVFDSAASENPENHWEQAIYYMEAPKEIDEADDVRFTARHNNTYIGFSFDD